MILNSLDWNMYRVTLKQQISGLPYNPDLHLLLKNIDGMVDELSRREVDARRTKNSTGVCDQLEKIKAAIETLEKWIMMAALIK